jgi:hypothetical protein
MIFPKTATRVLVLAAVFAACGPVGTGPDIVAGATGLARLDDEFENVVAISNWLVRSEVEGEPSDGVVSVAGGQLVLSPSQDRYVLNEHRGLSLFKTVASAEYPQFMLETQVTAVDRASGGVPTEPFHSAGLVIFPDTSRMSDWVVTNIGLQDGSLGFEDKSTIDDNSALTLYEIGELSGVLRLCVVDDVITAFTRLTSETIWTERNSFSHTIGATVGAGVMVNDYLVGTAEVDGEFEYVRFEEIDALDDCRS